MSVKEKGFQWVRSIRKSAIVGNSSCREGIPVGVLGDELAKENKSHCDSQARRSRIPSQETPWASFIYLLTALVFVAALGLSAGSLSCRIFDTWNLPGLGIEPVSPAFPTTGPPGKSNTESFKGAVV